MKSINWPSEYLPRTTDNFVSNEAISNEITLEDTWINLVDTSNWETYYGLKSIFETDFKRHSEPRLPSTAQINH